MNVQDMIKSSSKTSNPFAVTEWDSYIGQAKAKKRVQLMIKAAKNRGEQIDHQLILGSSGTGKTTLGRLIAKEHNVPFMSIMMTPSFSMEALASKLVAFDEDTIDENGELQTGGGICLLDEALALDTPIPTPSGWTTVGELEVGSEVFGSDGSAVTVLNKTAVKTDAECFRVTFRDGTSIVADAGHKWYARSTKWSNWSNGQTDVYTTRTMFEMIENGGLKFGVPNTPALDLGTNDDLPIHPYVMGHWLGNGTSTQPHTVIRDEDFEVTFNYFREIVPCEEISSPSTGARRVTFSPRGQEVGFTDRLKDVGVYDNKHIPDAYLRSSFDQRLKVLQGLMDTDGWISRDRHTATFVSTKRALADGVADLVRSLGVRANVLGPITDDRKESHQDTWKVNFTMRAEHGFSPMLCAKRGEVDNQHVTSMTQWHRIMSIEPVASVPVQCIEVDADDHLFLAGEGMVPTHNCHLLKAGQQHFLYSVLEDGYIPYNNGAKYFFQNRVTILAATTDEQRLSEALRGRFDNPIRLEEYTAKEMAQIVEGMCHKMGFEGTIQNYVDIANASAGRPRQAGALVRTARDLGEIDMPSVLEFAMITPEGLTIDDVAYLRALHQLGGKAGIKNIASLSMRDQKVVESLERDLVHRGLVNVTRGGREMTVQGLRTLDRLPEYM